MKEIVFAIIIVLFVSACANKQAHIKPSPATSTATWSLASEKSITECGATKVKTVDLTIQPNGEWQTTIKVLNYDAQPWRAYWHNDITATFELNDGTQVEFKLLSESMKAHRRKEFDRSGTWPVAQERFDEIRNAILRIDHDCEGQHEPTSV